MKLTTVLLLIAAVVVGWYVITWTSALVTWFFTTPFRPRKIRLWFRHVGNYATYEQCKKAGLSDAQAWELVRYKRLLTDEEWAYYLKKSGLRDASSSP